MAEHGDLNRPWVLTPTMGAYLILDDIGGFIETCYDQEVGQRIVDDHNRTLEREA